MSNLQNIDKPGKVRKTSTNLENLKPSTVKLLRKFKRKHRNYPKLKPGEKAKSMDHVFHRTEWARHHRTLRSLTSNPRRYTAGWLEGGK